MRSRNIWICLDLFRIDHKSMCPRHLLLSFVISGRWSRPNYSIRMTHNAYIYFTFIQTCYHIPPNQNKKHVWHSLLITLHKRFSCALKRWSRSYITYTYMYNSIAMLRRTYAQKGVSSLKSHLIKYHTKGSPSCAAEREKIYALTAPVSNLNEIWWLIKMIPNQKRRAWAKTHIKILSNVLCCFV